MSTTDTTPSPIPASGFRARVLAREQLFGTFLFMGGMGPAEIAARSGLDWVLVDQEHGSGTDADLLPQLAAIQAASPACLGARPARGVRSALVRVEQATRLRIGRALDLGAEGIMVPQVNDAATAREVVSWLRFPPAGTRGVALGTRGLAYGAGGHPSVDRHNERVTCIVQIESARGGRGRGRDGRHRWRGLPVRGPHGPDPCAWRPGRPRSRQLSGRHHRGRGRGTTPRQGSGGDALDALPTRRGTPSSATPCSASRTTASVLDKALRGLLQAGREAISSR